MAGRLRHTARLIRAGRVLAAHDALLPPDQLARLPASARTLLKLAGLFARRNSARGEENPLAAALTELGPSYIKLGQFLATRADLVGQSRAGQLAALQDRLKPFGRPLAMAEIRAELGAEPESLFAEIGPPVAAASIAQVHRAVTAEGRAVAVKVLRPGIEARFANDLDCFAFAAGMMERLVPATRRLRPVDAVATLAQSVKLEMDLRMEAAAMSEMAANSINDSDFRVPRVDWQRTARRVLTSEWIDGIPLNDRARLEAAGLNLPRLGDIVIQSFLRHAVRDGFFHADMHPGNLFADQDGRLVAVDYGIMGRLSVKERRFLAEILYGFIRRDYRRVSDVHFEAGYVPSTEDPAVFAQALRAVAEPILDKAAGDISMARLLTQLFEVTGQFNMKTQPQLLLLQKTMVVVEGVARSLNPDLNMWVTAEPVLRQWFEQKFGPQARLEEAAEGALSLGRMVSLFPEVMGEAQRAAHLLAEMAQQGGVRLDPVTTEALARAQARHGLWSRAALWTGAIALLILALTHLH